jgi:hypothetical protein
MAKLSPPTRLALRTMGAVLLAAFAAFVLHTATSIGGETLFGTWIYCGVMVGAAASCLARAALVRRERAAWALIGTGLLIWTGGEIYYEAVLAASGSVPIPSPADAGYLLFYPLTYAGLIVLLRERIGSFPFTRWLDFRLSPAHLRGLMVIGRTHARRGRKPCNPAGPTRRSVSWQPRRRCRARAGTRPFQGRGRRRARRR